MTEIVERPKRLSLSAIVELLLTKPVGDSSVSLTRNAKGETQIEVNVKASGDLSIADAETIARETYDRLRTAYPPPTDLGAGSTVTLSRNAKGDTQIEVKASGDEVPAEIAGLARVEFDRLRASYPGPGGFTGKTPAAVGDDGGQA